MSIEAGTTLGRYQILAEIGHGGMASVYKAFQPALERVIALKVLRPAYARDAEFIERFRREALAIARMRHPNIVQIYDFDASGDIAYLVMEHIEGGTLKQKVRELASQRQRLSQSEIVRITSQVADALVHAHAQGIVHRDVKPSNIMLAKDGRTVVTDFGIAKMLTAGGQTETGVGVGTPEYMSPEQGRTGPVDHRSDIYSLGVVAYELFTGRVPFTADTPLAVMLAHVREPLPLPSQLDPSIGPRLERVLLRALAKDPAARHPTAADLARALASAADTTSATVVSVPPAARRARRRIAIAPIALAAALGVGALVYGRVLAAPIGQSLQVALPSGTGGLASPTGSTQISPVALTAGGSGASRAPEGPPQAATPLGSLSTPAAPAPAPTSPQTPASPPVSPTTAVSPLPAAPVPALAATPAAASPGATATLPPPPTPRPSPTLDPNAPRYAVSGRAVSTVTGAGIPNVNVHVFGDCCWYLITSTTDASGNYSIALPSGNYRFQFYPDPRSGYVLQWWPAAITDGRASSITVSGAPRAGVNVMLPTGFRLSGKLATASGSAIKDGQVCIQVDGRYVGGAGTDGAGNYEWRLLNGDYIVEFYGTLGCDGKPDVSRTVTVAGRDLELSVTIP